MLFLLPVYLLLKVQRKTLEDVNGLARDGMEIITLRLFINLRLCWSRLSPEAAQQVVYK